ncbi:MAG: GAF domain-containing protein, partial [Chlorobi bacterium]|nr:GAF domain-containing protein [Chlorobiota bacterium]
NDLLQKYSSATFEVSNLINENIDFIKEFESDFKILKENIYAAGNSENGYMLRIKESEAKNDKILAEYPSIYADFIKLKGLKNELLQNGNPKIESAFLKAKDVFTNRLKAENSVFENASVKQIVLNNTEDWFNSVLTVFKIQKINGTENYIGIYDNLVNITNKISENIIKIRALNLSEEAESVSINKRNFVLSAFFYIILATAAVFMIFKYLKTNLAKIRSESAALLPEAFANKAIKNEFEEIFEIIKSIKKDTEAKALFAKNLKDGKSEITIASGDNLGHALVSLKEYIEKEKEIKKSEDEKRAVTDRHKDGIVRFGKIIRRHFGDIDEMTFKLLTELVRFLNADIGGIYIIDKNNPEMLVLKAAYAYNEKKIINKEIKQGEGLVGTCAADKSSIYIDRPDEDYIKIVSGFGYSKPRSLLLSPIYVGDKVYGVIELASSGTFDENDIKFLEAVAEDIAYTLAYLLK